MSDTTKEIAEKIEKITLTKNELHNMISDAVAKETEKQVKINFNTLESIENNKKKVILKKINNNISFNKILTVIDGIPNEYYQAVISNKGRVTKQRMDMFFTYYHLTYIKKIGEFWHKHFNEFTKNYNKKFLLSTNTNFTQEEQYSLISLGLLTKKHICFISKSDLQSLYDLVYGRNSYNNIARTIINIQEEIKPLLKEE